ncbi:MAG: S41 family peptidase [Prevotellaceae bacterium]|jgi:carboxyl-terminal processing protease|nr:S41 family peptidase [Prevotellaceae bacterium]
MKKTLIALIALLVAAPLAAQPGKENRELYESYNKLGQMLVYIDSYYVDTVNLPRLAEKAITHMLHNLDPHSSYLSAADVKAANEQLEGNFEGVGIEFNILNDTLTVAVPLAGGPSEAVGILSGDRIIAVDSLHIAGIGLKNERVLKLLRGAKGTSVVLTILRKGYPHPLRFTVVRDKIPIYSLDALYEVQPGLTYIRLGRFAATSIDEITQALKKLKRTPQSIILDLRGNSGGVLKTAIDLCDQFLDAGRLIVYNEGEHWPKSIELATGRGMFRDGRLIVLIDEHSASASEIVAGAIQDWDRGILMGRRSFGKGLVQQLLPLPDGSQVRLTVARYHTPTGRVIQRPYDAGNTNKYYADMEKRYSNGEFYHRDSIHLPDSLKYYTLVNTREVYGGGGIMPDIFLPADTSFYSDYYWQILRAGLLNQFVVQRMDKERRALQKRYKTFGDFDRRFSVDEALFNEFIAYAETRKIPRDEQGIAVSGYYLRIQMKALIARALWSSSEYYETVNKQLDSSFLKAVEVMTNWEQYSEELDIK